jgi:two-component system chemotaxis response regulator CheY
MLPAGAQGGFRVKIMTVDDSRVMRRLVAGVIEMLGYEVSEASNGGEALEKLRETPHDYALVVLDWNMPEMNGGQFLEEVGKDNSLKGIPTMMVTVASERQNIIKAIQAGARNYVTKPFTPEGLATKILECLGQGRDVGAGSDETNQT